MKTSDERKLEANFDADLIALEEKYLKLGLDPDYIADTYRGSAKESSRLWNRKANIECWADTQ